MYDSLILAAGFGSRLKPLTSIVPKPLVPFFGCPILYCAIHRLISNETGMIYINGHHLAHQIEKFLESLTPTVQDKINFQYEEKILGTGGPIATAHQSCTHEDLLIYNSDCLHLICGDTLYQHHHTGGYAATMALLPTCPAGKNPVYAQDGQVIGIGHNEQFEKTPGVTRHTLAGLHMVGRDFRNLIPSKQFFDVRKTYE